MPASRAPRSRVPRPVRPRARGAWLPSAVVVFALLGAVLAAGGLPPGVILIGYVAAVSLPLVTADVLFHRLPNRFTVPGLALVAWTVVAGSLRAMDQARHIAADLRSSPERPIGITETAFGILTNSSGGLVGSVEAAAGAAGPGTVFSSAAPWLVAGGENLVCILLGSIVYGASCALAWWCGGLGFGDVKLAFLLGAAAGSAGSGFSVVVLTIGLGVLAAFFGGLSHMVQVAFTRGGAIDGGSGIPIGPALIVGFWLAVVAARFCGAW